LDRFLYAILWTMLSATEGHYISDMWDKIRRHKQQVKLCFSVTQDLLRQSEINDDYDDSLQFCIWYNWRRIHKNRLKYNRNIQCILFRK